MFNLLCELVRCSCVYVDPSKVDCVSTRDVATSFQQRPGRIAAGHLPDRRSQQPGRIHIVRKNGEPEPVLGASIFAGLAQRPVDLLGGLLQVLSRRSPAVTVTTRARRSPYLVR